MLLRQRLQRTFDVFAQQFVQEGLLGMAEPEQERLMHLFEQGELRAIVVLISADRLQLRPGSDPAANRSRTCC